MFVEEHGAKLGEPVGWVFERAQDDRALVDRQREQLHAVVEGTSSRSANVFGADRPHRVGELRDGVGGTGTPASIIAARLWAHPAEVPDLPEAAKRLEPRPTEVTPEARYARWVVQLDLIIHDVYALNHHRRLYRDVRDMAVAAELPDWVFFDALSIWYASSQSSAIRRLVDRRRGTISLVRLLDEMMRYPEG